MGGSPVSANKPAPSRAEMTRRKSDGSGPRAVTMAHTRTAVREPPVKPGGRLKMELVLPVGIGAVVVCAALGIVAVASVRIGAPLPVTLGTAGVVLVAAPVTYVAWIVNGAVAKPLAKVR